MIATLDPAFRWCPRCETSKPIENFPLCSQSPRGRYGYCKPCKATYMREWFAARPEYARAANLRRTLKAHGITEDEYLAMVERQEGRCAVCGTDQPGQNATRLIIDHDHETGRVRGLLCSSCNRGIGYLRSPERLRAAAQYLDSVLSLD